MTYLASPQFAIACLVLPYLYLTLHYHLTYITYLTYIPYPTLPTFTYLLTLPYLSLPDMTYLALH